MASVTEPQSFKPESSESRPYRDAPGALAILQPIDRVADEVDPTASRQGKGPGHDQKFPLCDCVRTAVDDYLERMADHDITHFYRFVMDEVERPLLESVMQHAKGNQSHAARILGLSRGTLRKKMIQFGLISANDPCTD